MWQVAGFQGLSLLCQGGEGLQKVRPGSPVTPEVITMANEQTLAALAQQRQALEASNLPQIKPATGAMMPSWAC